MGFRSFKLLLIFVDIKWVYFFPLNLCVANFNATAPAFARRNWWKSAVRIEFNPGHPEYEAGMLITRPRRSVGHL